MAEMIPKVETERQKEKATLSLFCPNTVEARDRSDEGWSLPQLGAHIGANLEDFSTCLVHFHMKRIFSLMVCLSLSSFS